MSRTIFEDSAPKVATAIIILVTVSLLVYPLRVYTRIKHKAWGWDDWTMTFAVIPYGALSVFCLGSAFLGVGVHKEKLDAAQTQTAMMWFFFFEVFFCVAIIPIKLSIALMLMRVAGPKMKYIWALRIMSALFIAMNAISFFYIIFRCDPVSYAWDTSTPGGKCLPSRDLANIYYADTAVNIITDWFCALVPVPLLWNLKLNTNAKISVCILLSLGVLASLSACIRLKYTVNLNNSNDYLFSVADVMIWGFAENGIGFIVGCMTTLRPLFRKMFHLGSSNSSSRKPGYEDLDQPRARDRDDKAHPKDASAAYAGGRHAKTQPAVTNSQIGRKGSNGASSSTESEEYILHDLSGVDGRPYMHGIHVQRSVHQTFD